MSIDPISVNGNLFDWGSASVKLTNTGDSLTGITAIKYSDKLERSWAYGMGRSRVPRGRTRGKYSAEGSLTILKDSWRDFIQQIAAIGGKSSFGGTVFGILVQMAEDDLAPITDGIYDCAIVGNEASLEESSSDALVVEVPLQVRYITWNGFTLFDNTDGTVAQVVGAVAGVVAGGVTGGLSF